MRESEIIDAAQSIEQRVASLAENSRLSGEAVVQLVQLARRHACNGIHPEDPVREALSIVGNKWSTLILEVLSTSSYRYGSLRKIVSVLSCEGNISARMLTANLRILEKNGLVDRHVEAVIPPSVTYNLTDLGRSLLKVVEGVVEWGENNISSIIASRERFQEEA